MQKIKIGHRAKFRDRNSFFPQVLFPFRAILCRIFTSGVLHALLLIHSADACFLVMACEGYSRAQLRTLSSLLKAMTWFRTYGWKQYRNVFFFIIINLHFQYLADISKTSKNKSCLIPAITSLIKSCSYHSKKITV